ncbi:hypothetical protein JOL62DRAFT_568058 [Phyllosticta paracitricarpa]|uniref:Secreted protein n=1 Tax=Phyllosticta paracitricarpa TaxID=2016321 RepID=A0ABR1NDX7_9PEZI
MWKREQIYGFFIIIIIIIDSEATWENCNFWLSLPRASLSLLLCLVYSSSSAVGSAITTGIFISRPCCPSLTLP